MKITQEKLRQIIREELSNAPAGDGVIHPPSGKTCELEEFHDGPHAFRRGGHQVQWMIDGNNLRERWFDPQKEVAGQWHTRPMAAFD
jgi:hypothetical protein